MIIFEKRSAGLRLAEHEGVEYWLEELPQVDDSIHVGLTAVVAHDHHRSSLGHWTQVDRDADERVARAVIGEHHGRLLRLYGLAVSGVSHG